MRYAVLLLMLVASQAKPGTCDDAQQDLLNAKASLAGAKSYLHACLYTEIFTGSTLSEAQLACAGEQQNVRAKQNEKREAENAEREACGRSIP